MSAETEELGKALVKKGYQAYGDYVHWKAHTGKPMPGWEQLPPETQGAWFAFARTIVEGLGAQEAEA